MRKRSAFALKRARILSQTLFLGAFAWIFIRSRDPFSVVQNPFLAFDPLIFLTHPALTPVALGVVAALLALAAVLGRVFCGWICPMGSLIELVDLVLSPLRGINPLRLNRWRGRQALVRVPPALFILGLCVITIFVTPPLLPFFHPNVWIVRIFSLSWLGLGFLAFILVCAVFARRLWCVYLCPLGALYGFVGSFSALGLSIRACSDCGRCDRCPMEAADCSARRILGNQCTLCFDYEGRCPVDGFSFGARQRLRPARTAGPGQAAGRGLPPDPGRRRFLIQAGALAAGFAAGGALGALRRVAGGRAGSGLLRPPGVVDELGFLKRCIRCLHCVQSCPTRIIRATGLQAGYTSLFTPSLVFEKQGCEYRCQVCQLVCPNAAIPLQSLQEKQRSVIGLAEIDRTACVVFTEDKQCLVCEELCPIPEKAIIFETKPARTGIGTGTLRVPRVVRQRCIGCGICQANCPAQPVAIVVRRVY